MVCILLGQQSGYTKYPCFLCMWDSRAKNEHWIRKEWPKRQNLIVGSANVINEALVEREKIVFPPLHIKLGLIKQFVRALNKDGDCFKYLRSRFKGLSDEKVKSGIFTGPDIRKLIKDPEFTRYMMDTEYDAWQAFVSVVKWFLGNIRDQDYVNLVNRLLESFHKLGCNMSIKVHFLHSHLDKFPINLGDVSDEQGERFHQDIKRMEELYQGRYDRNMMADYCWSLKRDCLDVQYARKSHKRKFLES